MENKKNGFGKFIVGLGVGAGLGMLFAPQKGSETRKALKNKLDELVNSVKDIDAEEIKKEFLDKVDDIKNGLEDLDKEKVASLAKKKGQELKEQAEELIELAKQKGTPVLEGIAEDIREKAVNVTKEVLKKLEKSE